MTITNNVQVVTVTPIGPKGRAGHIEIGTVSLVPATESPSVENVGTPSDAILNFEIPQGPDGAAATIAIGSVTTSPAGANAVVVNSGTPKDAVFDFTLPRGGGGPQGPAATINIGTVTTGTPGAPVSVTNSGTTTAAVFNFSIPAGPPGIGDMQKQVYDSDNDGTVDTAEVALSVPWTGITGRPAALSAFVHKSVNQSVPPGTETTSVFDVEIFDVGNFHSTTVNADRLTAPSDGVYSVLANFDLQAAGSGERYLYLRKNGSVIRQISFQPNTLGAFARLSIPHIGRAVAGDYWTMSLYHTDGSPLTLLQTIGGTSFAAVRLGD